MILHQAVMLNETLSALDIIPHGVYVDATFGRGGHARAILSQLDKSGTLVCVDKDPLAIEYAKQCFAADNRVHCVQGCFSQLKTLLTQQGLNNKVNGLLLDLGVCSTQLDDPRRGFSFMQEGPLDMRMDPTGVSAQQWLNQATFQEIARVLKKYGEEPFAKKIAYKIVETRKTKPLSTTLELATLVKKVVPFRKHHPATKTFQAIRIHINQELAALEQVLSDAQNLLALKGRLVIISFHSLEDKRVKRFFQANTRITLPLGIGLPEQQLVAPLKWINKRQRASLTEVQLNARARSATLRAVEKTA